MAWSLGQTPSLEGRLAVVTGANIGLGYETALALAGLNCKVILACRNMSKAREARDQMLQKHPKASLDCLELDLGRLQSVREFSTNFLRKHSRLDLLINNAGIMMPPYSVTEDGFESQFGVNYLGHFALTGQLLPLLNSTPGARIVTLSSIAHRWSPIQFDDLQFSRSYSAAKAYGQSKLACLIFAYELHRRLRKAGHGTLSVAAHPGVSATNLSQHLPRFARAFAPLTGVLFNSAAMGALPTLYAALGQDIQGGDYCGPRSLNEMRGQPAKVGSNRASRDLGTATQLWEVSQKLANFHYL